MPKRIAVIASCIFLIWAISVERTYAWLGLQSAKVDGLIAAGLHPLSFAFVSGNQVHTDLGDVRWQLIGQRGVGAKVVAAVDGLHVQPTQPGFELRLNLAGAALLTSTADALVLQMRPEQINLPPLSPQFLPKFSLAVHASANDPGWIADLGANAGRLNAGAAIDLNALIFQREPGRTTSRHWRELPALTHLRLYGSQPNLTPFVVEKVSFKANQIFPRDRLTGVRPEKLLAEFYARRADAQFVRVDYRGLWLAPVAQMWLAIVALIFAMPLLGFEFASIEPKARAIARVLMIPALFLPIVLTLWGTVDWAYAGAVFAPNRIAMMLLLAMILGYRWICRPPRFAFPKLDARSIGAWRSCALPTLSGAFVLILAFAFSENKASSSTFGAAVACKYLMFAGAQQWLLQTLVLENLRRAAVARFAAIVLSALTFALLHTPNFALMLLCFCAAMFWCNHYARHRQLLPLMLSHALLGFLSVSLFPPSLLRSADVGVAFFLK